MVVNPMASAACPLNFARAPLVFATLELRVNLNANAGKVHADGESALAGCDGMKF